MLEATKTWTGPNSTSPPQPTPTPTPNFYSPSTKPNLPSQFSTSNHNKSTPITSASWSISTANRTGGSNRRMRSWWRLWKSTGISRRSCCPQSGIFKLASKIWSTLWKKAHRRLSKTNRITSGVSTPPSTRRPFPTQTEITNKLSPNIYLHFR